MSTRGEHLVRADRRFATGGGRLARLVAPAIDKLLAEIDRKLVSGGFDATLPDGSVRRIGFHAPGARASIRIASWMALVRLATSGSVGWYKAWALGEWSSPDPVAVFELFSANSIPLGDIGRAKGPFRWINAIAHRLRDNAPSKARKNIAAHYDLGNDLRARRIRSRRRSCTRSTPCSTGSSSGPASGCSKSAAAGAPWRSRLPGAGRTWSG